MGRPAGRPAGADASYFDAFLYLANWGTRQLMFRLPSSVLELEVVTRYCATDTACAWTAGDSVIVSLTSEQEEDDWDDSAEWSLESILPVRAELAMGDRRLLYLAWLLSVGAGEVDETEFEPPVPPGLRELSRPLRAVVEFLRLDEDLLSAAAEASEPLTSIDSSAGHVRRWVAGLPAREKEDVLVRLVTGDVDASRELIGRFRTESHPILEREGTRTVADLQDAALQARERRERLVAQRRAEAKAARARTQAAAREQHLTALAARQEQAWTQANCAIEKRQPANYDQAVTILKDLRAISDREDRRDAFDQRLHALQQRHARKIRLLERLERAGLAGAAPRLDR
jgi:hypothetical protein